MSSRFKHHEKAAASLAAGEGSTPSAGREGVEAVGTGPQELPAVAEAIHDYWFDLDQTVFDAASTTLSDKTLSTSIYAKANREGYATAFENRYRLEHHLEIRGYYFLASDVLYEPDVSLFPP